MSNDRTSDNMPLKQAELPPAQRHTAVTDTQSATGASELISTLTHVPRGEPLVTERSKELIRDVDL
jgi:hypothetical protein